MTKKRRKTKRKSPRNRSNVHHNKTNKQQEELNVEITEQVEVSSEISNSSEQNTDTNPTVEEATEQALEQYGELLEELAEIEEEERYSDDIEEVNLSDEDDDLGYLEEEVEPEPQPEPEPELTEEQKKQITYKRKVTGAEKKLNDAIDQEMFSMPWMVKIVGISDKWNIKVRQPLANVIAKRLIAPMHTTDDSGIRLKASGRFFLDMFDIVIKLLLVVLILTIFPIYNYPLVIGASLFKTYGLVTQLIMLFLIFIVWEEENRLFRSVIKYMDYYSNNMVDNRLTDTPENETVTGKIEGYKVGWATGTWKKFTSKLLGERLLYQMTFGLIMYLIMLGGTWVDKQMGANKFGTNIDTMTSVANQLPFLLIFITVFFAPMIEEFVFRGIIFRAFLLLNEKISPRTDYENGWQTPTTDAKVLRIRRRTLILAFITQALLFSIAHSAQTLGYGGALFLNALLLQFVYYKTGDIRSNIRVHAWSNAYNVLIPVLIQISMNMGQ